MLRVAIICEGSSDYPVLRRVAEAVLAPEALTFREIQPDFDALQRKVPGALGPGWQGVRAFLGLPNLRVAAETSDILVVQVDADIRSTRALASKLSAREEHASADLLEPLCDHVKSWIGDPLPESVVIVLPRESTETWLVAVHTKKKSVETIADAAAELVSHKVLAADDRGGPVKSRVRYAELAAPLAKLLSDSKKLTETLPELSRFASKLRVRARAVKKAKG